MAVPAKLLRMGRPSPASSKLFAMEFPFLEDECASYPFTLSFSSSSLRLHSRPGLLPSMR